MVSLYQLAFSKIYGIGPKLAKKIIEHYGKPEAIFEETESNLRKIFKNKGGEKTINDIVHKTMFKRCEQEIEWMNKYNVSSYFFTENDYPKRLKQIPDCPICLFVQGNGNLDADRVVAIVGSRNASDYGKFVTDNIVAHLKGIDAVVVSGLAYGIDASAHRASVHNDMSTFGVMGHGLDMIYPTSNFELSQQMKQKGGLVTEYFTRTEPLPGNFPARNRIIAGLSDLVIVVQAALRSGALSTARLANDYNREVLAVPGKVNDPYYEGCHYLIEHNMAHMYSNEESIDNLMHWNKTAKQTTTQPNNQKVGITDTKGRNLQGNDKIIYNIIKNREEIELDDIIIESGLPIVETQLSLFNLEMADLIVSTPGKVYKVL